MFDLGFWELALVSLVALVVIGPERLPQVLRTAGNWLGRLRGMSMSVRQELENELYQHEIREQLEKDQSILALKELAEEVGDLGARVERDLGGTVQESSAATKQQSSSVPTPRSEKNTQNNE